MLDLLENETKTVLEHGLDMILFEMGVSEADLELVDMDKLHDTYKRIKPLNPSTERLHGILRTVMLRFKKPKPEPESNAKFQKKNFRRKKSRVEGDPTSGYNTFKRLTLLATINERPGLSTSEVCERGGISYRKGREALNEWLDAGLISKSKSGRSNIWNITPEGTVFLRERSQTKFRYDLSLNQENTDNKQGRSHPEVLSLIAEQAQNVFKKLKSWGWYPPIIHNAIAKFGVPRILCEMAEVEKKALENPGKFLYVILHGADDSKRIAGIVKTVLDFASEEVKGMFVHKATDMVPDNYWYLANILAYWHERGRELSVGDVSAAEGFIEKNQRD